MIAAPWYLLSIGIITLIIGGFMSALTKANKPNVIDANMTDDDIAEGLQKQDRGSWGDLVVFAGGCMILISIVWRILRWIF